MTYRVPMSLHEVAENLAPWRPHVLETSPRRSDESSSSPGRLRGETTSGDKRPETRSVGETNHEGGGETPGKAERDIFSQTRLHDALHSYLVAHLDHRTAMRLYRQLASHVEGELDLALGRAEQAR